METLTYSKFINASVEKVWNTMLEDSTYREWTKHFHEGSHYVGDWSEGSKMMFIGPNEDGTSGGIVSHVNVNRQHQYIELQTMGIVGNGVEDTTSEGAQQWIGGIESYTFTAENGGTRLEVSTDVSAEEKENMHKGWEAALDALVKLAEGS